MADPTLSEIMAKLEVIESEQRRIRQLLEQGVKPPEWVSGKALSVALGLRSRGAEYYRHDLGVIPVDGIVCRRAGKSYEYQVEGCSRLVNEWRSLPAETRRSLQEIWEQSKPKNLKD